MSSSKKRSEGVCDKCARQQNCEYKPTEGSLTLLRCLDFEAKENTQEENK